MVTATRALQFAKAQAEDSPQSRTSCIENISVIRMRQRQTRAEAFRALHEHAEPLYPTVSRHFLTKLPAGLRSMVLSYLTIDVEKEIRLTHQSQGGYRLAARVITSRLDVCDRPIQLPEYMEQDFVAAFLGHLYCTRTFIFDNWSDDSSAGSLHVVKHLVDRDHYALGLAPELLVRNVKIRLDYCSSRAFFYDEYAGPVLDDSAWEAELTEALTSLSTVKSPGRRLQLELRLDSRDVPGDWSSDTPAIRLGLDVVLPLLHSLTVHRWRFNVTLQDYVSKRGNMLFMTEASGNMTTESWLEAVEDWIKVSTTDVKNHCAH
jgi:hypothetical protein